MEFKVAVAISLLALVVIDAMEQKSLDSNFQVPEIPTSLLNSDGDVEASTLIFLWQNRLNKHAAATGTLRNTGSIGPATVLAVDPFKMSNLVPQDAAHPLFSDKYEQLTDEFILDSLSTDIVDSVKVESPEGFTMKTMSGKSLLFKKSDTAMTVNEIPVKAIHQTLGEDPVAVFVIEDFLFNHRKDVQEAFEVLAKESKGNENFLG